MCRKIQLILYVVFFCTVSLFAKEKIAVFDFQGVHNDANMTAIAENEMISLLVEQKRFDVVERQQLARILQEQQLSNTGIIDVEQATEIGKIAGIKYAVFGQVTNVNYSAKRIQTESGSYLDVDALIALQIRIVDIQNGSVIFSKAYNGKPSSGFGSLLSGSGASDDAETTLTNILKKLYEKEIAKDLSKVFPIEGSIVAVEDKSTVIIDIGTEQGVTEGMSFDIVTKEEKISERTQKNITIVKKIGSLKVKEVTGSESSVCKIKDGKNIEEGMLVQLQK